jgi:hypothetical protein
MANHNGERPHLPIESFFRKFISGLLGSSGVVYLRGLPPIPWIGANAHPEWWQSLIFVILGGGVAVIWDDDHLLRSFLVGVSWPALVIAFSR